MEKLKISVQLERPSERKKKKTADEVLEGLCMKYAQRWIDRENPTAHIAKARRLKSALLAGRGLVDEFADELEFCPCCQQKVSSVTESFNLTAHVETLYKLVKWCQEHNKNEFEMKEVRHLLDHTQYANLNHMTKFAGIVYRPVNEKTGKPHTSSHYGINLKRAWEFFRNERPAPVQIVRDRLGRNRKATTEKYVRDFPALHQFLDSDGNYDPDKIVSAENAVARKDGTPTVPDHYSNR